MRNLTKACICTFNQPIVKLLSPVLSLPTPNKATNQCGEEAVNVGNRPDYLEERTIQKLLLVGSGASTILKQVDISIMLIVHKQLRVDQLHYVHHPIGNYQCSHVNISIKICIPHMQRLKYPLCQATFSLLV